MLHSAFLRVEGQMIARVLGFILAFGAVAATAHAQPAQPGARAAQPRDSG